MAFWNRREKRSHTSGLAAPSDFLFDSLGTTATSSGKRVTVDSAMGLSPVWAAVSMIAEQVQQLPLKVYRDAGDGEAEEARTHRAWRMLHDRPNSHTPAGRFWSTVTVHLLLYGNCFIRKFRDENGVVDDLWILPPSEVAVKWWPLLQEKTYVFRPSGMGEPVQELDDDQILHIFGLSIDGQIGMSVIEACKTSLGTALARDEFEGKFYANGAVLSQALEYPGMIKSPEALKRVKESMQAVFSGSGKAHQIGVFESGAKLKTVGSPLRDLEFVSSQNMTRTDVAVMFKLPPNYLGGSSGDGLTYSTVEMNQTAFALHAIAPICKTISDAVSQDASIMPQNIHYAEFTLEGMLRANAEARANVYEKLVGMKAMLPEEVRRRENLPPLTAAQKRELSPPVPPQLQLAMEPEAEAEPSAMPRDQEE